MKTLYEKFKKYPYAQIELKEIEDLCQTDTSDLNWNIVYLEKCGYVELGRSTEAYPSVACSAAITAEGIELVENADAFYARFPSERGVSDISSDKKEMPVDEI